MKEQDRFDKKKCRLCGSESLVLLYVFSTNKVSRCRKCGFTQIVDRPREKDIYDLYYSGDFFQRGKYVKDKAIENVCRRRVKWLQDNGVPNRAKVLDVGCATGDFIMFAKKHFDMWGVDISKYAVDLARRQNPDISERIFCQRIEDFRFPDEFFDVIVLWDVLEHLWDPLGTLTILQRFIKKGGVLAFSTPNIGSHVARLMGKHWALMTVPEHLCFFNRSTVELLYNKVGLETVGWMSKGTWCNMSFLIYKFTKAMFFSLPTRVMDWTKRSFLSKWVIYVPTGDIQFCAAKKRK